MSSKKIRAHIEERFKQELTEKGFTFYCKPQIGLRYTRETTNSRTECISLATGCQFGATIEIYLLLYFQEISRVLEQLLLKPNLTAKKHELATWTYTQAISFMLRHAFPIPDTSSPLIEAIEDAEKAIVEELSILSNFGIPMFDNYPNISSLVNALENERKSFNRYLRFNHLAIPVIYGLTGRHKKALEHVEKEYLSRHQDYVPEGTVGFYRFARNIKIWLEQGAPIECAVICLD